MNQNRIQIITVLLLVIVPTSLYAQSKLFVRNKSGYQTNYELNGIKKLTFSMDKITISKNSESTSTYELSDIRYLSFVNYATEIKSINNSESGNFKLYPNPVIDQIQISYELTKPGNMLFEITDLLGKVLYQQIVSSQIGANHITFYVEQLPTGLYICHIKNDNKQEVIKFFKD